MLSCPTWSKAWNTADRDLICEPNDNNNINNDDKC